MTPAAHLGLSLVFNYVMVMVMNGMTLFVRMLSASYAKWQWSIHEHWRHSSGLEGEGGGGTRPSQFYLAPFCVTDWVMLCRYKFANCTQIAGMSPMAPQPPQTLRLTIMVFMKFLLDLKVVKTADATTQTQYYMTSCTSTTRCSNDRFQ